MNRFFVFNATTLISLLLLTNTVMAQPVLNPTNNHWYDIVDFSGDWDAANNEAVNMVFGLSSGHLVSITSQNESEFLLDTFGFADLNGRWTGGFQVDESGGAADNWAWSNGDAFAFSNWWPGEPNNFQGAENRIGFAHGITNEGAAWNDAAHTSVSRGFVVEFNAVPEPNSAGVLVLSSFIVLLRRKRVLDAGETCKNSSEA